MPFVRPASADIIPGNSHAIQLLKIINFFYKKKDEQKWNDLYDKRKRTFYTDTNIQNTYKVHQKSYPKNQKS